MACNNSIDTAGRPQFLAYLANPVSNVTGNLTTYQVAYDTVTGSGYDIASNYNTSTHVFTAPIAARYCFGTYITLTSLGAGHTQGNLSVYKNGSVAFISNGSNPFAQSVSGGYVMVATAQFNLAVNDTIDWRIQIGNSTLTVGVAGTFASTAFWGCLVD